MSLKEWKNFKRTGGYRRRVQKKYKSMVTNCTPSTSVSVPLPANRDTNEEASGSVQNYLAAHHDTNDEASGSVQNYIAVYEDTITSEEVNRESESDSDVDEYIKAESKKEDLRENDKNWAVQFNISHVALNALSKVINNAMPYTLPLDARTLLRTMEEPINIIQMGTGNYWHNGLNHLFKKILRNLREIPNKISLNFNIDGLPIYKSSNNQLWPILCNIAELKNLSPIVVGIYQGKSKPSDLNLYLNPFVNEMQLIENGLTMITLTGVEKTIEVYIRAFICDSPARALIKGVSNFNSKHGCQKCTVVGEYSHLSHTVIFPEIYCPKRYDADFRAKKYGQHHKVDSPLLKLKIDMVENFPVADSLHLVDLGVMKRLLIGWRDGNFIKRITKWCSRDIEKVNQFLLMIRLPKEIHRAVRTIDVLSHWKASEYRTFLLYLGLIILKYVLNPDAYNHYMCFCCAITICSSESHFKFLRLAQELLCSFINNYKNFYGRDYITSNVHNLAHLVDEVRKFGILQSFNAYPFENNLQMIKNLLRQGNNPLAQVARRLQEKSHLDLETYEENTLKYPFVKQCKSKRGSILVLHLESFILSTEKENKWFLTTDEKVVETQSIYINNNEEIRLKGYRLDSLIDAFDYPLKSSLLNIYKCENYIVCRSTDLYEFSSSNIKCKLLSVEYNSEIYFIPLIHTL